MGRVPDFVKDLGGNIVITYVGHCIQSGPEWFDKIFILLFYFAFCTPPFIQNDIIKALMFFTNIYSLEICSQFKQNKSSVLDLKSIFLHYYIKVTYLTSLERVLE